MSEVCFVGGRCHRTECQYDVTIQREVDCASAILFLPSVSVRWNLRLAVDSLEVGLSEDLRSSCVYDTVGHVRMKRTKDKQVDPSESRRLSLISLFLSLSCPPPSILHKNITMSVFNPTTAALATRGVGRLSITALRSSAALLPEIPEQQQRFRWTKAKKKRFARHELREVLEQQGKSLPTPPYFFPKDTPVVNAVSAEERDAERKAADLRASEYLKTRLAEQQAEGKPPMRHHFDGIPMSERVQKLFDLHNGNQMEVVKAQKQRGMELFQMRPGDTGSSAVQVIALTSRIQQLQTHMAKHKKDKHSKRGMDALYSRRRKLLDYMERKDFESYRRVVKTLGLSR